MRGREGKGRGTIKREEGKRGRWRIVRRRQRIERGERMSEAEVE